MNKKEAIWRELLVRQRTEKRVQWTQKELAQTFRVSVSTVFHALRPLREGNIVRVHGRFFILEDYKRLLYLLASAHSLSPSIIARVAVDASVSAIEGVLPTGVHFALYSGFKELYKTAPAEYDHVYVSLSLANVAPVRARLATLPVARGRRPTPNVFLIAEDPWIARYPQPLPEQLFIDLWNAPEWYAKDFLTALEQKLL